MFANIVLSAKTMFGNIVEEYRMAFRLYVLIFAVALCCGRIFAAEGFDESVDRNDPNFVHASLLHCGRANTLYGCSGHIAIRLQCPHYNLDEVFSYESELVEDRVLRFFMGRLKMGMFATPMSEFVEDYYLEGRGIREYELNLSPQAKVRLWKIMDERVAEGAFLPYDYIKRGCAQSALKNLLAAIAPEPITIENLPKKFKGTRHEVLSDYIKEFPWKLALIYSITGPEADRMVSPTDAVIMPGDLIEYLNAMRVNGAPVISETSREIKAATITFSRIGNIISPMVVALFLLILSIIGYFVGKKWIHATLLVFYALLAIFETYISVFSSLPCAAWNVLLIAFNPLPLIFWKWRKYWGIPYAAVLIGWSAWVFLAPHLPTDPAFAILALAYAAIFIFAALKKNS